MTSSRNPLVMLVMLLLPSLALPLAARAGGDDVAAALARGDAAWARRAEGFAERGRPDAAPAAEAIALYEAALAERPDDLDARFRLMDALWFQGHFVETDEARARKTFDRLVKLTEDTVRLVEAPGGSERALAELGPDARAERVAALPRVADAHFWAAISWGLWAMSHGNAASGFKGVARRIRDHAEILCRIDERFADAGGPRLLGRLHAATPRVAMFTGWIDRERGIAMLERANAISTADPRNPLFLAEALLEHAPERREEALALLREVAERTPDPTRLVEQSEIIEQARRVLEKETETRRGGGEQARRAHAAR